jgi:hypothetical protein
MIKSFRANFLTREMEGIYGGEFPLDPLYFPGPKPALRDLARSHFYILAATPLCLF